MLGNLSLPISLKLNNTLLQKPIPSIIFSGRSDKETNGLLGRPSYDISAETLEEIRGVGFSWDKIFENIWSFAMTIQRRVTEYGLENISGFSTIGDQELDTLILDYLERHNRTTGLTLLVGYISVGYQSAEVKNSKSFGKTGS